MASVWSPAPPRLEESGLEAGGCWTAQGADLRETLTQLLLRAAQKFPGWQAAMAPPQAELELLWGGGTAPLPEAVVWGAVGPWEGRASVGEGSGQRSCHGKAPGDAALGALEVAPRLWLLGFLSWCRPAPSGPPGDFQLLTGCSGVMGVAWGGRQTPR